MSASDVWEVISVLVPFGVVANIDMFVYCAGTFSLAQICNIRVHSIRIGRFGKLKIFEGRNNVRYIIGYLPFGGSVDFHGGNDEGKLAKRQTSEFGDAPIWSQAAVALGGLYFALTFAGTIFATSLFVAGHHVVSARIKELSPGSPAFEAGLMAGDRVIAFNGKPIREIDDLLTTVSTNAGVPLVLLIDRQGARLTVTVNPRQRQVVLRDGSLMTVGVWGVQHSNIVREEEWVSMSFVDAVATGFHEVAFIASETTKYAIKYKWDELRGIHEPAPEARPQHGPVRVSWIAFGNLVGVFAIAVGIVGAAHNLGWLLLLQARRRRISKSVAVYAQPTIDKLIRGALLIVAIAVVIAVWNDIGILRRWILGF